jgi:hypothetical protein
LTFGRGGVGVCPGFRPKGQRSRSVAVCELPDCQVILTVDYHELGGEMDDNRDAMIQQIENRLDKAIDEEHTSVAYLRITQHEIALLMAARDLAQLGAPGKAQRVLDHLQITSQAGFRKTSPNTSCG